LLCAQINMFGSTFAAFALLISVALAQNGTLCPGSDTLLVIDSSQSITKEMFEKIKEYAVNFISIFNEVGPGPNQAQFGCILFNEDVQYQWPLNRYSNKVDLQNAIRNLPYMTGITNTYKAFTAMNAMLTQTGARPNACKGIVLFTDGRYDNGDSPIPMAVELRNTLGATIISVAVDGINGFLAPYDRQMLEQLSGNANLVFELPGGATNFHTMKKHIHTRKN